MTGRGRESSLLNKQLRNTTLLRISRE